MARTCDVFALINVGIGLLAFIFNCGFNVFSENRDFNKKLAIIKGEGDEEESLN